MPTINYKNIPVYYEVQGVGKPVVLLHGFLENSSMWQDIAPALAETNRVICIDLFGHGDTGNLGYIHTMEDQARMVKYVLDELQVEKAAFIGHSMGGYIALAFAELYPEQVSGLVLLNSTAQPDDDAKKLNREKSIQAIKKFPETFVKMAIPNLFSEENRTKMKDEIAELTREALRTSHQGIIAALEGMKVRKDRSFILRDAGFPILMIISKKDPALEYTSLIEQVENSGIEKYEFPDGHMSYIENKDEIIPVLKQFVKKCD